MSDCDILNQLYPWLQSGSDCCVQTYAVTCADGHYPRPIVSLKLQGSEYTGSIPSVLGTLTSLTELSVQFTAMAGTIPTEIGNLHYLETLLLTSDVGFSGSIPTEFGNLISLTHLVVTVESTLTRTRITGNIPTEFGNLKKLNYLELGNNMLSGPIPSELGYLKKLRYLSLKQNSLSGNIPPELGNNRDLERLYLYDNSLEGSIPESFGNLTNLLELWLNDNKLSGTIPTQLGLLSNIFALHLERNQLSGTIPNEVINLPNLQSKDFSGNDIILTTTGILAGDYQLFSVLEKVSYVLILLNALVLAGLIAFALQYEANSQIASGGFQIRRALTNFNITLGAMGICVLLLIVTDLCTLPQELQVKGTPQNIITFVLVATFELCFIKYSFSRSANIIESIFPRVSDWLTRFVQYCPIVLYLQVIPPIILAAQGSKRTGTVELMHIVFPIIAGFCTAIFDLLLLIAFSIYIHTNTRLSSSDHIDPRFMIIAQYGAVASVLCFSTSFVIFAPTWDPFTFKCFSLIAFILLMGVTVALFAMKLRLYFNSQLEQKVLSSNYKRAKDIAEGRASELGKTASYYKGGSTGSGRTTSGRIPSQIPADSSATTLQGNRMERSILGHSSRLMKYF